MGTVAGRIALLTAFLLAGLSAGCGSKAVKEEATPYEFRKVDLTSDFMLGIGDSVEISVYKQDDLKRTVKIDSSGKIMFPLIGDVEVSGKSTFKLRDELQQRLSDYFVNPQVTVTVTAVQSKKFLVLGEVKSPGIFPLDGNYSVTEAIAKAGGLNTEADECNVLMVRRGTEKPLLMSFNFRNVWETGNTSKDIPLQTGDIVFASTRPIVNVSRFMQYVGSILSPVVMMEGGIVMWPQVLDVFEGKSTNPNIVVPTQ